MNGLTQQHRASQLLLRRSTLAQFVSLWPLLKWDALDDSFAAFSLAVAAMVQRNRATSTGLAVQYLRLMRASHVRGAFPAVAAASLDPDQLVASLHATSVAAAKRSAAAGTALSLAQTSVRSHAGGAMVRLVLNAGRDTIRQTSVADPRCEGWQRVGDGSTCEFCSMLLGRGAVYREESAEFESHDHCGCTAEPVYA